MALKKELVQLRLKMENTSEEYIRTQAWLGATITRCPLGKKCERVPIKHGTYGRKYPDGTRIARFYCQPCGITFSLLPDCLASSYSSTVVDIEETVQTFSEGSTFDEAVQKLRPDIELQGGRRWLRRRIQRVRLTVLLVGTLYGVAPTKMPEIDLRKLREKSGKQIHQIPTPIGFCPHPLSHWNSVTQHQHTKGPDPPE